MARWCMASHRYDGGRFVWFVERTIGWMSLSCRIVRLAGLNANHTNFPALADALGNLANVMGANESIGEGL